MSDLNQDSDFIEYKIKSKEYGTLHSYLHVYTLESLKKASSRHALSNYFKTVALSLLFFIIGYTGIAQKVKVNTDGNYYAPKQSDINTGKTFTDDSGKVYIVYANSKNKLYIIRRSKKTNKEYKSYLKVN